MVPWTWTAPALNRRQRVRDTHTRIVVRVDADRAFHLLDNFRRDTGNFAWHRAAVGVAQYDNVHARILRGLERCQSVPRIVLVSVEEMLGVVHDFLAVLLKVTHGVADHRQVFLRCGPNDFRHVQRPRFADHRHHRRVRLDKHIDLRVILALRVRAARAPEGRNLARA